MTPDREPKKRSPLGQGSDESAPAIMDGLHAVLFGFRAKRPFLTKSERAYAAVRRAIVTHALPAGVPLDESMLLEHFAIGRTPLREALKRLSYEGLLNWPPHQAPLIRDVGLFEMQQLYETRRLLDYKIAILAAERATDAHIEQMDMCREKLVEASRTGFVYESVELDYGLHAIIAQATQNHFLAEASNSLNLQSLRLWFRAQFELGVETIHESHTDLVSAISRHDAEAALQLAIAHVDSSLERQNMLQKTSSRLPR